MTRSTPDFVWSGFKAAFCTALDESSAADLLEAWRTRRTSFYEFNLMPQIGKKLGCELETELHRRDYAFLNAEGVPLVFIEAENAQAKALHEISCLCSMAAPLKVLLLSCDWKATESAKLLPRWLEIIRAHHSVISLDCLYAIIVGEWDEPADAKLEYSLTLINTAGVVVEQSLHIVAPATD